MSEQNIEAKLKNLLKQQKIQLWKPPFTQDTEGGGSATEGGGSATEGGGSATERGGSATEGGGSANEGGAPGLEAMQTLSRQYSSLLSLPEEQVGGALESIRVQAVTRGRGNRNYRETGVATLELLLPRENKQDQRNRKSLFQTKLDVSVQDLSHRICEEFGLKSIKLILNGRTLNPEKSLDEQNVTNNSKVMVLKVNDCEKQEERERERKRESLQRTRKGFEILSEREEDVDSKPFLEIADQKGNPLNIPPDEKKALILAMGFHEKGRSLMKRKQFDEALSHFLQADQHFSQCGSALLSSVDNPAVLQLDIVWCYRALEALTCLDDSRARLQRAENSFSRAYGEQQERLKNIQGSSGREEVLFLRLFLLQSLLFYVEGNDAQARERLTKVVALFSRLSPDPAHMQQLMSLGFTETESRLSLRETHGDLNQSALLITSRREEREQRRRREQQKRKARLESVSVLVDLGFNRKQAARALNQSRGNVDQACSILLNSRETSATSDELQQLLYLGFHKDQCEVALSLTSGDLQAATQLLLENQGVLPPELTPSGPSSSSGSASSSGSSSSAQEPSSSTDEDLVSEVLDDISPHEEDYLDLTLEEESELIATLQSYLHHSAPC